MKVGVFWRKFRNVEYQKRLTPNKIYDDAYGEAYQHYEAIIEAGFDAAIIEWDSNPYKVYKQLSKEKVDIVFNASSMKEIAFLETFDIPYVGSGLDLVATNKSVRKNIIAHYDVPTPKYVIAHSSNDIPEINLKYPLFVKPISGRGSAGIDDENIIYNENEIPKIVDKITNKIGQAAIIEEFIKGREICVGFIGYKDPELLPLLEIKYNSTLTNTYEHKMFERAIIRCPVDLPNEIEQNIMEMGLRAYRALNAKDYGRIDIILSEDNIPYFLEINTFAGLTISDIKQKEKVHHGYMGYMAKAAGYIRADFIEKIIRSADRKSVV